MKTIIVLIIAFFTSCGIVNTRLIKKELIFNGHVYIELQSKNAEKSKLNLNAEITVMKQDSSIIKCFITYNDGTFSESIKIKSSWSPLIVKIKSLDELTTQSLSRKNHFYCTEKQSIYQNITFLKNTFYDLPFECKLSDDNSKKSITKEFLKGRWEIYNPNPSIKAYSESNSIYVFSDSSFTNVNYWFSDQGSQDSCEEMSRYSYSTGKFDIKNDVLLLEGAYTDNTFKVLNSNPCTQIGYFQQEIEVYRINEILYMGFKVRPNRSYYQTIKFIKK